MKGEEEGSPEKSGEPLLFLWTEKALFAGCRRGELDSKIPAASAKGNEALSAGRTKWQSPPYKNRDTAQ